MVDNILRFQIPMNDLILMHVVKCSTDLLYNISRHFFIYFSLLLEEAVELSRKTELQDQVDKLFIRKERKHLYYVWMVQESLDFYLTH